jgi:hypothetical protein
MSHKYWIGLNIILTQLRCFVSFSNYDLFQINIVSDPSCREDSYHFFFDCSYYTNMKHTLFHNLYKTTRNLSDLFIYSNMCSKIVSFCSFESIGLPLVKSLRSIAQSSELRKRKDISQVPKHYEIGP